MKNCCEASSSTKKCFRASDNKVFSLPRRFSKKKCMSSSRRGFTMRSSCAPYNGCRGSKRRQLKRTIPPNKDKKTRRKKSLQRRKKKSNKMRNVRKLRKRAGARPPLPYIGTIFKNYDDVTLGSSLSLNQTDVGNKINALITPQTMSANEFSQIASSITTSMPQFTGILDMNGRLTDYTINYLIIMLEAIDPMSISGTDALGEQVRGLYLQELQRVRTSILQRLHMLQYPVHTIKEYFDIDTNEIQQPAHNFTLDYDDTRDTTDTFFNYSSDVSPQSIAYGNSR